LPNELLTALTEWYLYDLRDAVAAREKSKPSRLALLFQAVGASTEGGAAIGAPQVNEHPVKDFLRSLWLRLRGDLLDLHVKSNPPSLDVYIDGSRTGRTETSRPMTPGTYKLALKNERGDTVCPSRTIALGADHWQGWQCSNGQWTPFEFE
jgi:hypothetical protein